jgi:hypothetical protein
MPGSPVVLRRAPARNGRTWTLSGIKKRYGLSSLKTVACSILSLLCESMSNPKQIFPVDCYTGSNVLCLYVYMEGGKEKIQLEHFACKSGCSRLIIQYAMSLYEALIEFSQNFVKI